MILTGAHRPGARLVQGRLAKQLNVSRGVVREALMELQAGGLIETNDNRGAVVAPIDRDRLEEAFDLREMMEGLAARRCCQRMTLPQLRELRGMVERMDRHLAARQWREGGGVDRAFHLRLIEIAGSRLLQQMASGCLVVSKFVTTECDDPTEPARAHGRLLDAIAAGDAEAAERLAREQVRSNRANVEAALASGQPLHWITSHELAPAPAPGDRGGGPSAGED
jgi:DNA-binding GntR family transcriptional regulator